MSGRELNTREGAYGQRAKKRLGQHFLKDRNIIAKILRTADIREGDQVLEIGPGPGYLTKALLAAGASVTAVELDRDLCEFLEDKFSGEKGFELIRGDALKQSFVELSGGRGRFKAVSNPPYNITGPLLIKFIEERAAFTGLVLMLQKEVAERIISGPGSKKYGSISVRLQVYYDIDPAFRVSRDLFTPRPKVDSMVITFTPLKAPRVDVVDERFFAAVVRAAFGRRRKTLCNALGSLGIEKERLKRAIVAAGINPGTRAETLGLDEFSRLTKCLYTIRVTGSEK